MVTLDAGFVIHYQLVEENWKSLRGINFEQYGFREPKRRRRVDSESEGDERSGHAKKKNVFEKSNIK